MSTTDPLHDAFEELARRADLDLVPDRLAGIRHKRRATQQRRTAVGASLAALAVVAGGVAVSGLPGGANRTDGSVATTTPDPTTDASTDPSPETPRDELGLVLSKRIVPAGGDDFRVSFRVTGTAVAVRDRQTGGRVDLGGILGTRILLDGESVSATDPGDVECIAGGPVETYDQRFGPFEVTIPPGQHTVSVSTRWCNAAGDVERTVISDQAYYMGRMSVADRARVDLDGDGTLETLRLLDEGSSSALEVSGSMEGTVQLPSDEPTYVSGVADLDGDGAKEVLVDAREGDLSRTYVVTVGDGTPRLAGPAAGSPALLDGVTKDRFLGAGVLNGVLTSWAGDDPGLRPGTDEPIAEGVPLDGGTWTLEGTTLRFTPWSTDFCSGAGGGPVEC
jgi:hypothetical protein